MDGLRRPRLLRRAHKRLSVLGGCVDGVQKLAHRGNQGELCRLSRSAQPFVEGTQPWIASDRCKGRQPEISAEFCVSKARDACARRSAFARMAKAGNNADVGGECLCAIEARRIPDLGDDAGGSLRPDAVDRREQPANLVTVKAALDLAIDFGEASAPEIEVLADVTGLKSVDRTVVLTDGMLGARAAAISRLVKQTAPKHVSDRRDVPFSAAGGGDAAGVQRGGDAG